jgi:antitoxin component YwqK of YwqJK toxin-antitoxin module
MNRIAIAFAVVFSVAQITNSARAQATSGSANSPAVANRETAKIEPYTGPPIYLPEKVQVDATWVNKQVNRQSYDDGKPKIEREISTFSDERMVNDGYYREFFANGQLFLEGQYERGTPVGEWKYYHDNGQIARAVNFEAGRPIGEVEVRRADGTIEAKRAYDQGKRNGQWTVYDATGEKPLREEHYVDGQPDGVWKLWHDNGKQAQETSFQKGKRHGITTEWDKEGVKRGEANFVDGLRDGKSTIWPADGKVIEQTFRAGKLVSQPVANGS